MSKPNLIILHGALGSEKQFFNLQSELSSEFQVHTFNFSGHGGKDFSNNFSIPQFTLELDQFLSENKLQDVLIFGYSMGGYVALNLARTSKKISGVFTLGTKFHWSPESAAHEIKMLNPAKIEEKVPAFATALAERHFPLDWKEVMHRTADLMINLGNNPLLTTNTFKEITIPVTITRGTLDNMVSKEESESAAHDIPNAKYIEFADFKHPIEQVDINKLAAKIRQELIN
ncbi:alpha/beta fold hydrolase [Fulvivirga lutea]|uniref:Alpha/beta fold hydrolase n=1 Tax=Fulvivirga lutea TaxID=2810512 RepID=A0A974WG16_9BACT|nr:alpha/beta fold hydrolase [Fulvivirga lutea]QSE97144.1 alpha/beta fold hydrolase [Fulvivirga lutea]